MTMPTAEASIAFATDPLAAPSWTVIQQPRGFSTKRLRSPQLGRFESGTFDGVFGNTNRSLEPLYASGANYPNVRVRKRMRLRATHNAVTYPVYDGFIESIKPTYPAKGIDAIASLSASDAFRIFAGVQLASPYPGTLLADVPSGYYRLNETSGTTVADSSGNGFNGVYSASGVTYGVVSPVTDALSKAVTFDGVTGSANLLGGASVPSGTGAAVQFSVEFWMKTTTANQAIIAQGGGSGGGFMIGVGGDGKLIVSTDTAVYQSGNAPSLTDGAWHYVCVTFAGTASATTAVSYVDGGSVTTGGLPVTTIIAQNIGVASFAITNNGTLYPAYSGSLSEVAIYPTVALSLTRVAAHYAARLAYSGQTSDVRVTQILDTVGWPSADRDLSTGIAILTDAADLGSKKALDHLRDVDGTEAGALFMSRAGAVTFRDRHATQGGTSASSTSQMTFGDGGGAEVPYTDLVIAFDDKEFANQITVTRRNGVTSISVDSASVTKYGAQGYSRTSLALTDTDAASLGQWLLLVLKDPNKLRFERITVTLDSPLTNAAIAAVLGREIWDRVTVAFQPPGGGARISQDVIVTGISHHVTPSRWNVDFQVSGTEIGTMLWRLETAGFGELGQTTSLGY